MSRRPENGQPLIEILPSPHYSNRAAADYVVRVAGDYPLLLAVVRQATAALEFALNPTASPGKRAEHDASIAIARAKKII